MRNPFVSLEIKVDNSGFWKIYVTLGTQLLGFMLLSHFLLKVKHAQLCIYTFMWDFGMVGILQSLPPIYRITANVTVTAKVNFKSITNMF